MHITFIHLDLINFILILLIKYFKILYQFLKIDAKTLNILIFLINLQVVIILQSVHEVYY